MHLKRWITGLIALPFLIFLVYLGGLPFFVLVGSAAVCSLWEYFRIVFNAERRMLSSIIVWWGYPAGLLILGAAHFAGPGTVVLVLALNLVCVGLFSVFIYKSNPLVGEIVQKQVQGMVYIPLLLSFLVMMRREPDGMVWIFFLLGIIFAGDTSAYYVGSYLGRHKLNPAISPGKTIEGLLGGLFGSILGAVIVCLWFFPGYSLVKISTLTVFLSMIGVMGDLTESMIKRTMGVKDSGNILPGHGGVLDRLDSLMIAAPVLFYMLHFSIISF